MTSKEMVYKRIKSLFPTDYTKDRLPEFIKTFLFALDKKVKGKDLARIPGKYDKTAYKSLTLKYSNIPIKCDNALLKSKEIILDLFSGIPRWRSPNLQHNVGAPVNTAACAGYSISMNENIYNINDGLAGNALVAEQAVSRILSDIAGLKKFGVGLFTFGGTATNLYATRLGIKKVDPNSNKEGVSKKIRCLISEDHHYSHKVCAEWLGIGTKRVFEIKASMDRTSDIKDAEKKMEKIIKEGNFISSILINGGTTYNHTIDNIIDFVKLRDKIVRKYSLNYKPHIHIDSVIGWEWLFFKDYNFKKNSLNIDKEALGKIKKQYNKISQIKYADSWSADFHKGVGGCPVSSTIIMLNNIGDLNLLSKKQGSSITLHQVAEEFSFNNPTDFTLETSRSGGAAISALISLHTLGIEGYQRNLANLIEGSLETRKLLEEYGDIRVINPYSDGYVTMVRIYPPRLKDSSLIGKETFDCSGGVNKFIDETGFVN